MEEIKKAIFNEKPTRWGLRGDQYLWDAFEEYCLKKENIIDEISFEQCFNDFFRSITGNRLEENTNIYVKKFGKGGISSGYVSCDFWIDEALPLLLKRFKQLN